MGEPRTQEIVAVDLGATVRWSHPARNSPGTPLTGHVYVNSIGFHFGEEEFRPGLIALITPDGSVCQVARAQFAHLKVLRYAGLVVDQLAGNRRIYRVDPEGLAAFRAQLDGFWSCRPGGLMAPIRPLVQRRWPVLLAGNERA